MEVNAQFANSLTADAQPFPGLLQGFGLNVPWAEMMRGHVNSERHAIGSVAAQHPSKGEPESLRQLSNGVSARQLRLKVIDWIVIVKRLAHSVVFKRQPMSPSSWHLIVCNLIPSKPELLADVAFPLIISLQFPSVRFRHVCFLGGRSRSGV